VALAGIAYYKAILPVLLFHLFLLIILHKYSFDAAGKNSYGSTKSEFGNNFKRSFFARF
jgi:hypothetical protein